MKFSDIIGHKKEIKSLREIVDSGNIPHALLFCGKQGIGKVRVARAFSQYVHCRNRINGEPCGVCPSCVQENLFNNPDTHYVYPVVKKDGVLVSQDILETWREMNQNYSYMPKEIWNSLIKAGNSQPAIFVSESDDIISKSSLSNYQENYKIFIIWQPEKMRVEAANKLLKIIEEPFEDTIFILVSNEPEKILPTIFSRTQRINFKPLSQSEIAENIKKDYQEGILLIYDEKFQQYISPLGRIFRKIYPIMSFFNKPLDLFIRYWHLLCFKNYNYKNKNEP